MNTCKLCHQQIYNTFIKTGMGRSFDLATKSKSAGDFKTASIYDKFSNFRYHAFWSGDSLYFKEYRLQGRDTTFQRTEQVNYIIGSGQHTNSHLHLSNGYLSQMPMTFYTQKKHWDLPPGFENGVNTRFSRKIGLECMSCHNGYPAFVKGSENKYERIPNGIDCERCHGPGSIHVSAKQRGDVVDTSRYVDYTIVNPAKLSIDRQFDICQRCHLQGNAVLKEGKSFYDFRPGKKLSDYLTVFLPKYKNADDEFIMASHADRLKQSRCFIQSYKKAANKSDLKPYKEAMTCVTCHNPHVSVRETNRNVFNDACTGCHTNLENNAVVHNASRSKHFNKNTNCVGCHMPSSGSIDIPHVSVHDHYIRKPLSQEEKEKIKTFLGLYAINETSPDRYTRALAYINEYEKFSQKEAYLDSAKKFLSDKSSLKKNARALIQLYFIKRDYQAVLNTVNELGENVCAKELFINTSYENADAWCCYRIAESYYYSGNAGKAESWFAQAAWLAPFNLDFRNKYGTVLAATGKSNEAIQAFEWIMRENPEYVSAYSNLGYLRLMQGQPAEALRLYKIGIDLDPDNEALLLNLAGYYLFIKDRDAAAKYLKHALELNPRNEKVKGILKQLS
jgi:predicted CXXCH cytochrome family protein